MQTYRLKAFYVNLLECVRFSDVYKLRISGNVSLYEKANCTGSYEPKKSRIRIFLRKFRLFLLKFWGTTPPLLPQESVIIYKSHCQVSLLQIKEHLARATSLFPTINCRHSRPASPEPVGAGSPESSEVTGMIPDPCTSKSSQSPAKMPL